MKDKLSNLIFSIVVSLGGGFAGAWLYLTYNQPAITSETLTPVQDATRATSDPTAPPNRIIDQVEADRKAAILNKAMAARDIPALLSLVKDPMISGPAAMTLIMTAPNDEIINSLIEISKDNKSDIRVRTEIINALSMIEKNEKIDQFLIASLKSDSPRLRLAAAKSIAHRSPKSAVPYLIRMLDDGDQSVAGESLKLLSAATGEDFGKDKTKWLEWWENEKKR